MDTGNNADLDGMISKARHGDPQTWLVLSSRYPDPLGPMAAARLDRHQVTIRHVGGGS